jgi:hypothetical protein
MFPHPVLVYIEHRYVGAVSGGAEWPRGPSLVEPGQEAVAQGAVHRHVYEKVDRDRRRRQRQGVVAQQAHLAGAVPEADPAALDRQPAGLGDRGGGDVDAARRVARQREVARVLAAASR